ncbi:VOC family protein [Demequina sp. NBRC 110056]|uniref:VOC family protein n=1 Tax=Demequina sp. NBRC 110056 TaxID=1570345 RepID=UPI0009FBC549|nr:VOC family protein [Demequina sp. NBRC 110056]
MGGLCWWEIPVTDLARATAFYAAVFRVQLTSEDIGDGQPKSLFPAGSGIPGALASGPSWTPSATGVIPYLDAGDDMAGVLERVVEHGGSIVEPRQAVEATSGYWARFLDTEGNVVGVLSAT